MQHQPTSSSFTALPQRKPGHRLITQNVLSSAAQVESLDSSDWATVQDLSAFIDLFCLYEKAVVLGRGSFSPYDIPTDFFGLLKDTHFIQIEHPSRPEDVTLAASKHLVSFLGEQDTEKYRSLLDFALQPDAAFYGLTLKPDRFQEIQVGNEWLLTTPSRSDLLKLLRREEDVARGTTFLVRTFLYLAYADVFKITFTPDAVRTPVLEKVLDTEKMLAEKLLATSESTNKKPEPANREQRDQLLSRTKSSWEKYPLTGDIDLKRKVSPFAAIVFERSRNRKQILTQMRELREQLKPLRSRLRNLEDQALSRSRDEAMKADQKWNEVLAEVERSYGYDPHLITIRRALNFGDPAGGVIDKPQSWKAWATALVGLPIEVVYRMLSRRPAIEIHKLRPELPSHERLVKSINRLFR